MSISNEKIQATIDHNHAMIRGRRDYLLELRNKIMEITETLYPMRFSDGAIMEAFCSIRGLADKGIMTAERIDAIVEITRELQALLDKETTL